VIVKEVTKVVEVEKEKVVEKPVEKVVTQVVEKVVKETVAPPQRTKITYLHFHSDVVRVGAQDLLVGNYNRDSLKYVVEPVFVPFGELTQKWEAALASGEPFDILLSSGMDAGRMGMEKKALNLDAYWDASKKLPPATPENWVPYTILELSGVVYQGKKYGVPFQPDTRFLFLDVKAFKEVGLDPEKPPVTWDDLWTYADKLDKGKKGAWQRIGFCPVWGQSWFWMWLWSMGWCEWDQQNEFKASVMDRPEVRECIQWHIAWRDRYGRDDLNALAAGFTGLVDAFITGMNPILVHGSWMPARYKVVKPAFEIAYAMFPRHPGKNGRHSSWGAGHCMVIAPNSKHPDGAWDFIEWFLSAENMKLWCTKTGTFVGRADVMNDPDVQKAHPHYKIAFEQLKLTNPCPTPVPYPGADYRGAMLLVWDGKATIDEALKQKQEEANQAVQDWIKTHPGQ